MRARFFARAFGPDLVTRQKSFRSRTINANSSVVVEDGRIGRHRAPASALPSFDFLIVRPTFIFYVCVWCVADPLFFFCTFCFFFSIASRPARSCFVGCALRWPPLTGAEPRELPTLLQE